MPEIRKGTYVLIIVLDSDRDIPIGALGIRHFSKGIYCYVGSAMNGLDQRLGRHLRKEKCIRWHIDNLTVNCSESYAYESYPDPIPECDLAKQILELGGELSIKGFGCSDCNCDSHLFKITKQLETRLVEELGMKPFFYAK